MAMKRAACAAAKAARRDAMRRDSARALDGASVEGTLLGASNASSAVAVSNVYVSRHFPAMQDASGGSDAWTGSGRRGYPALGPHRPATPAPTATSIAAEATRCLRLEIDTWPKPGLVSHVDAGSHDDMTADTFYRSAAALAPFFAELADAGAHDADMPTLRKIGLRAERAMLAATGGVNTHRGAIFGLGLLCAGAGLRASPERERYAPAPHAGATLGALVAARWGGEIVGGPRLADSHGERAGRRYGAGGARAEAAAGFARVYAVGVPALRDGARLAPDDAEAARVHACFALIAALDDTNLLHRGGRDGLDFAQRTAREFLATGGVGALDWRARAAAAHRAFVARRLSPGGAADLLAMSLFVAALDAEGLQ
ncbi:ATP:dephospho-CoA triphosphoribosyl transferase [Burkholderia humptydooensis MSMB43]|nr:ATP:dephospho-CoA triphosphoribosyl transferase [Burkholderia humptydooensis MSMB43]